MSQEGPNLGRSGSSYSRLSKRPDIFRYLDYRAFLKDLFQHLKKTRREFSIRSIATECQIASGYLPMVLAGRRNLSFGILERILPHLHLNRTEERFLENLVRLGSESSPQA